MRRPVERFGIKRQPALALLTFILAIAPTHGLAQDRATTEVRCTGEATVEDKPTHVAFWIHRTVTADSVEAAAEGIADFEPMLRAAMTEHGLSASQVTVGAAAVSDTNEYTMYRSAQLRFSIAPYSTGDKGAIQFGALCDNVLAAAASVGAVVEGPTLTSDDERNVTRRAIAAATANAYPAGESVAEALSGGIVEVAQVQVVELVWNPDENTLRGLPTLQRIACRARVEVTYTVELY